MSCEDSCVKIFSIFRLLASVKNYVTSTMQYHSFLYEAGSKPFFLFQLSVIFGLLLPYHLISLHILFTFCSLSVQCGGQSLPVGLIIDLLWSFCGLTIDCRLTYLSTVVVRPTQIGIFPASILYSSCPEPASVSLGG